jgi:hypothetical protein
MVPTVDRAKATVTVKIRFVDTDARVLPEMSAKVAFLTQEVPPQLRNRRTVVQPSAVVEREGRRLVFVVRDDRAVATPVELGVTLGDQVEVIKGVEAGQKVVANPSSKLHDGAKVATPAAKS